MKVYRRDAETQSRRQEKFPVSLCLCGEILTILALSLLMACHHEQPPNPTDPFRDVPTADRESLRTAVRQFADFQVSRNWEQMYENLEEPKEDKNRFLRRRAAATSNLLEFYPTGAAWIPEYWTITGCGVFQFTTGGPTKALVGSTRAKRGSKGWTLAPISIDVFPNEPGHMKSCSPPR